MSIRKFREGLALVPVSADPASPVEGQLQRSDGTHRTIGIWEYKSGSWQTLGGSGGGLNAYDAGVAYLASPAAVIYYIDNKIYKCIVNTSAGESPASHPSKWQALSVEASSLEELSDVDLTSSVAYDSLINDGTNFVNTPPVGNYIKNSLALFNTTGYAVYADAAAASPVDGTGGSANVTITRNTTSPLRGVADFKLSKDAVNRQGQGWSYDFTIDRADQSKPLKFSFDYKVSANFSYANNDLVMYIYDVTNAQLIQPTPYILDGSGKFVGEFQTNANSTSYRAIWHVATTNASAWDVNITNVVISATPVPSMVHLQDKQYDISSYVSGLSPIVRAIAIPYKTKDGTWRLKGNIVGGHSSSSSVTISITGVTFKNVSNYYQAASGNQYTGSTSIQYVSVQPNTNQIYVQHSGSETSASVSFDVELNSMPTWAVDFYPVSLSDGAETRVVAAHINRTSIVALTTTPTDIIFNSIIKDDTASFNTSTGEYTIPVTGWYEIAGRISWFVNSSGQLDLMLQDNSTGSYANTYMLISFSPNGTGTHYTPFCHKRYYIAGVKLKLQASVSSGATTGQVSGYTGVNLPYSTQLNISRISGPATIAASEKVNCRYTSAAGQSIPDGAETIVNFGTKVYDTHNAVVTGASWKFVAPRTGKYCVLSGVTFNSDSWGAGSFINIRIVKNGTLYSRNIDETEAAGTFYKPQFIADDVYLLKDEYVDIRLFHNRGGSTPLDAGSTTVYVSIHSID